ncbi:protein Star [Procambarus clarkii]|uniref:protein Star n=1 Tax=Procambarus clarkii TaxID=6728 RepID=UPI003743A8F0
MLDVEEEEKPQGTQKIMWDPGFNGIPQDDPDLIAYIREFLLEPPAGHYNLDEPYLTDFSEFGQSIKVDQILHKMSGGFFLEAGAANGEAYSNTLFAERERGWRGVLVEPDPYIYQQMRTKGRNAYTINTCLALKPTPHMSYFQRDVLDEGRLTDTETELQLQCLPLYSILLALNVTTVDYLSLDLVGYELQVLQTIPWDKMRAMVISVDFYHNNLYQSYQTIENYMVAQGYVALNSDSDFLFAHPQLMIETINNIITGRRH